MRRIGLLAAALMAGASLAQYPDDCRNGIGLFTGTQLPWHSMYDLSYFVGPAGTFTVYGILIHPHDENTGEDMDRIGGYELRVSVPPGVFILETILPAGSANAGTLPDFIVTTDAPVLNDQCVLFTLTLGEFSYVHSFVYLQPPSTGGSIPGSLTVFGTAEGALPSAAVPVSGDVAMPVFQLYWFGSGMDLAWIDGCIRSVPTQDVSFSALKSLYR